MINLVLFQLMSCSAGGKAACGGDPNSTSGYLKKKGKFVLILAVRILMLFGLTICFVTSFE